MNASAPRQISIVLANYNQAHLLRKSVERLESDLALLRVEPIFILVEDGSTDRTWDESMALAATRPSVQLVRHEKNKGRGRSVADGIRAAMTELVATLDTDLEVPAFYLLPLLQVMDETGADIALARRWYPAPLAPSRVWELSRWMAHRGYRFATRAAFGTSIDTASGCRVFRRETVLPVLDRIHDERWFWDTELIVRALQAGLRIEEVTAYCAGKPPDKSTVQLVPEVVAHLRHIARLKAELLRE